MSKKKFKNVLVVLGGNSGERAVSLDSGRACIKALKNKGYNVSTFDPKYKNFNLINTQKIDVIFNALHGKFGEDGIALNYYLNLYKLNGIFYIPLGLILYILILQRYLYFQLLMRF